MKIIRNLFYVSFVFASFASTKAQTGISDVNFTPRSILHTHINSGSGNGLQITNTTTGNGTNALGFTINSSGNDFSLINNQAGVLKFQTGNSYMMFQTNGSERLRILPNGNIGIGTTNPTYSFEVNGSMGVVGNAVFSGGYVNFGSIAGISGYGLRDSSGVLQYKHSSSGSWTAFSLPPAVPGNTEWWIRPTSALYIQPMANSNIRVYDASQTYGLWYDGGTNKYAIYARTSASDTVTSAITGFSDISGNQTYGYLGYQGKYKLTATDSVMGSAVYGVVDDPGRTAGFFRTTGNANTAANINFSNVWMANFNYVINSSATSNPSSSYSQLDVSNASLGGGQSAVVGYSMHTAASGNNGFTIGGSFVGDGNTQDSYGVKGLAYSVSGNNTGGYFFADATTSTSIGPSVGTYAESADIDAGIGVFGIGNATTAYVAPNSAGAGGAFCGERYGAYAAQNSSTAGTGYDWGQTYSGLIADATATANNAYHFGVHGKAFGAFRRTGGVIGTSSHSTLTWGSLGYINSSGVRYSGYGSATAWTNGAGKSATEKSGVAFGGYGDLYGSWFRGEVYGMAVKGERYGLYIDGKQYTNDIIAVVSPSASKATKTATYVQTSMSVDVYAKGTGVVTNNSANIQFSSEFSELISETEEVIVTITPIGRSANLYIESTSANGFVVKEEPKANVSARPQPIRFTWIAVATKKGYENPQNPDEVMQNDYDKKLEGFMFNENNTTKSAIPMWWDGQKIRFDEVPQNSSTDVVPKENQKVPASAKSTEKIKPATSQKVVINPSIPVLR